MSLRRFQFICKSATCLKFLNQAFHFNTRNSSGHDIATVNFRNDDIRHALQNTIDSCINSATDRYLQRKFTKFSE